MTDFFPEITETVDGSNYTSGGPVPRYPKARVDLAEFMAVDAIYHMMMQACAELRRAGASEQEVADYRGRAINGNPYIETARWVSTGPRKGARNG